MNRCVELKMNKCLTEQHLREQFPEQPGELGVLLLRHRRQIVHHCTTPASKSGDRDKGALQLTMTLEHPALVSKRHSHGLRDQRVAVSASRTGLRWRGHEQGGGRSGEGRGRHR